jgi:hypothetical protein
MDTTKLLEVMPKWIFAFAAVLVSLVVAYAMVGAKCSQDLFGMSFGPSIQCSELSTNNPSPKEGIVILGSNSSIDGSGVFQDSFTLQHPALLIFQADASNGWDGEVSNAGIKVVTTVNRKQCATNQSFEGSSGTMTFNASTTCTMRLEPGAHRLEAKQENQGVANIKHHFSASYYLVRIAI